MMWKELIQWALSRQRSLWEPLALLLCSILYRFHPSYGLTLMPKDPFPGYYWAISRVSMTLLTSGEVPVGS